MRQVLFAFEEAIGFMPGPMYRDKDGISSAVALCEMAAHVYSQGGTLRGTLSQLYDKYGSSAYRSGYFIADVPSKSRAVFDRLRAGGYPKVGSVDSGTKQAL
jgi:phosphoglucomutase